eukprot:Tbor_TRINITY_DN7643_c0_g1::TRINITY_DN7643_c0_g1_i1::g.1031::m.1031
MTTKARDKSAYLSLEPTTLYFPPPHSNRSIRNELALYNRHHTKAAVFKIKSVNPQKYVVTPACGVIKGLGVVKILITLKPVSTNDEPHGDGGDVDDEIAEFFKKEKFKCSAKFINIPINATSNPSQIWAAQEGANVDYETSINAYFTAKETANIPASSTLHMEPIPLSFSSNSGAPKSVKFGDGSRDARATGSILKKTEDTGNEVGLGKSRIVDIATRIHLQTEKRDSLVKELEDIRSMQTVSEIETNDSQNREAVITYSHKIAAEGMSKTLDETRSESADNLRTEQGKYDIRRKEADKMKAKRMSVPVVLLGMIVAYSIGLLVRQLVCSDRYLQLSSSTLTAYQGSHGLTVLMKTLDDLIYSVVG